MTTVAEIMTRRVITVAPETDITEATRLLLDNHINGMPVVEADGRVVGILCQSDVIAQQKRFPLPSLFTFLDGYITLSSTKQLEKEIAKIAATSVRQAMTPKPVTVTPETSIETVATLMVENNFHTLPVVAEGRLVGIVGKEDVLRTIGRGIQGTA